jgi:hypothetical protein
MWCFHFYPIQNIFKFPLWFLFFDSGLFGNVLFNFQTFEESLDILFCYRFLTELCVAQRVYFTWLSLYECNKNLFSYPNISSILFHEHFSCSWVAFSINVKKSTWLEVLVRSFLLLVLPLLEEECRNLCSWELFVSPLSFDHFLFIL